jgi:alkyl hydroperoxide reductase subunit AhpC
VATNPGDEESDPRFVPRSGEGGPRPGLGTSAHDTPRAPVTPLKEESMTIRLGDLAPDFTAKTTDGTLSFHEWKGSSWAVLFSHPKDFTPVCTTELGRVAGLLPEFEKRNTKVMGLSVDPLDSHRKWVGDIADVTGHALNFPLIADDDRRIADLYDMIHPNANDTQTVRSVFIVGPDNKVKLTLTYPASTGRNFDELLRVIDSLQLTSTHAVATPADWKSGEDVIIGTSVSDEEAQRRFPGYVAKKPYLRVIPQPGR